MPSFYVRVALFNGETPTKIISGQPAVIDANTASTGLTTRVVDYGVTTTSGMAARSSLPTDERLAR